MSNNKLLLYLIGSTALIYIFRNVINRLMKFNLMIGVILKHEGGYVNDPDDLGGETNFGITKRRYPNLDIKNLTKAEAIEIYKRDFYLPMGIDKIENLNLALNFFDMGVNAGKTNATKILAQATEISESTKQDIVKVYKELRIEYYKKVATYRNNQKYLNSWINRVNSSNIT